MRRIVATIIVLVSFMSVYAQQISIHSPTASNLGVYGEIPVSYYTGTPNIFIPLYEIRGKHVTIPLKLSYHPAGIRPEIHPGTVGLGWSIHAGGVISRTVRGNGPDESNKNNRVEIVEGFLSYISKNQWLAQDSWKSYFKNNMEGKCAECESFLANKSNYFDLEPDEFNFSVLDISGKFYFDHRGKIQVQCDKNVKVVFNNEFIEPSADGIMLDYSSSNSHIMAIKSFTIIDEEGTQYLFGGASAIEFSDPISYGRGADGYGIPAKGYLLQATSWFLTQIRSANGADIINFEYERGPFVSQLYRSFNSYSYSGANMSGWQYKNIAKDGTLISPVYLKRITVTGGEIIDFTYTESNDLKYPKSEYNSIFTNMAADNYKLLEKTRAISRFNPSPPSDKFDRIQWLKLNKIAIKIAVQELKKINFFYNNTTSERLFLDSLNISGSLVYTKPLKYSFLYKNRDRLPTQYLTCITDHCGFNNGKTYPSNGFSVESKMADAYYTDSGVLSEICYPTGGSTKFEYELHDYSKVVSAENRSLVTNKHDNDRGIASGLRIKKIITNNIIRDFFYKKSPSASLSSGILNLEPKYVYSITGYDCGNEPFYMNITRSLPVIPLTKDNEGLHIGYTYVCEQITSDNSGYIQYHYTNHDNGHSDTLLINDGIWNRKIFPSNPHCSRFFERGRLKKETFYNSEGRATACNEISYKRYGSQGEDNPRAMMFEGIKVGYDYCSSVAYLHYCYKFLPSQIVDTTYNINGQNPIITQTNYLYNSTNLISQKTKRLSDGSIYRQVLKYPADFQSAPYPAMVKDNILNSVVEISIFKNSDLIEKRVNDYALLYNTFYAPINSKHKKGYGNIETRTTFSYDSKTNIREITKDDIEKSVYLWSYSNKFPIAEIKNVTYTDVESVLGGTNIATFGVNPNPTKDEIETFLSPLFKNEKTKDAMITYYSYKPLFGMTSKTDVNGLTTYYKYDDLGRLEQVKDCNNKIVERYDYHYKK